MFAAVRSRSPVLALAALLIAAPGAARAQPDPAELGDDVPVAGPAADDARERYDRAFAALVAGDLDAAVGGLDDVALRAADPDLRAAARELARLARELRAERIVFRAAAGRADPDPLEQRDLPEEDRPGAGRIGFVYTTTIASLYAGSLLVPILDLDIRTGAAVVTGVTGAGFLGGFYGSRGRDISEGMAASYRYGLLLGTANALLLASPIGVDSSRGVLSLGLAGEALGGIAAMVIADRVRPTVAAAEFTFLTSVMGIGTAGLGLVVLSPDIDSDAMLAILAGGLDVGAAVGISRAQTFPWSNGRTRLVLLSAILGSLAGAGGSLIVVGEPDSETERRVVAGTTLAATWTGLGLGVYLTRNMAPHPRFRLDEAQDLDPSIAIAPTLIEGAPGLVAVGSF